MGEGGGLGYWDYGPGGCFGGVGGGPGCDGYVDYVGNVCLLFLAVIWGGYVSTFPLVLYAPEEGY